MAQNNTVSIFLFVQNTCKRTAVNPGILFNGEEKKILHLVIRDLPRSVGLTIFYPVTYCATQQSDIFHYGHSVYPDKASCRL